MPQTLDGKFFGLIFRQKDNTIVPPSEFVVFLAKDRAFLPTLRFYKEECQRIGAETPQLEAIDALIGRVEAWQRENVTAMKIPDVHPGELAWERVVIEHDASIR